MRNNLFSERSESARDMQALRSSVQDWKQGGLDLHSKLCERFAGDFKLDNASTPTM